MAKGSTKGEGFDLSKDELPIIHALAICRAPKGKGGWLTIGLAIQGDRVVDQEILQGPDSHALAIERGKLAFANRFMLERGWNSK